MLVLRALTPARLLSCVRAVTRSGASLPPELLCQMFPVPGAKENGAGEPLLTERELTVLRMLADGEVTRGIARGAQLLGADGQEHRPRRAREAELPDPSARGRARHPSGSDLDLAARLMARRVAVIGLDCAEPGLVFDAFADELPNLTRLMARGRGVRCAASILRSPCRRGAA